MNLRVEVNTSHHYVVKTCCKRNREGIKYIHTFEENLWKKRQNSRSESQKQFWKPKEASLLNSQSCVTGSSPHRAVTCFDCFSKGRHCNTNSLLCGCSSRRIGCRAAPLWHSSCANAGCECPGTALHRKAEPCTAVTIAKAVWYQDLVVTEPIIILGFIDFDNSTNSDSF